MSRTREIEVWVSRALTLEASGVHYISMAKTDKPEWDHMIKAKLIIELPERKVTISKSELRNCFDSFARLENDHDRMLVYSFYEFSKEKLFKDA